MDAEPVTVAIPVRNGGARLREVLAAVRGQQLDRPVELVVADSGSTDGSVGVARAYGATVIPVAPGEFSHSGTRNELLARSNGSHVAFLTQDAVPATERWLARLLDGFMLADDVALVFGPYLPRADASPMVVRELAEWFGSFAHDGRPQIDRGTPGESASPRARFFTDANGCVARWAWAGVPFPDVEYAEDQALARDMLASGHAKAYHPDAAVIHSHDYPPIQQFRRSFDEWRALAEVRGMAAEGRPLRLALDVQRRVRDDLRYVRRDGARGLGVIRTAAASLGHHTARVSGAALGSRAARLPAGIRRASSLEGRAGETPAG